GKIPVQRQNYQIVSIGNRRASSLRATNLRRSRQKDQDVSMKMGGKILGDISRDEPVDRRRNLFGQRALVRSRQVLNRNIEPLAFGTKRRGVVEKSRNRPGVESRRHHD